MRITHPGQKRLRCGAGTVAGSNGQKQRKPGAASGRPTIGSLGSRDQLQREGCLGRIWSGAAVVKEKAFEEINIVASDDPCAIEGRVNPDLPVTVHDPTIRNA